VAELKLAVKRLSFVINYVPDGLEPAVSAELARLGIELAATVPLDEAVREYDLRQKSLLDLPDTSPAVVAVDSLMAQLMSGEPARLAGG
ncbi:MAG: hypothetical protein V1780_02185, partial [Chloroflexota bacterium]